MKENLGYSFLSAFKTIKGEINWLQLPIATLYTALLFVIAHDEFLIMWVSNA